MPEREAEMLNRVYKYIAKHEHETERAALSMALLGKDVNDPEVRATIEWYINFATKQTQADELRRDLELGEDWEISMSEGGATLTHQTTKMIRADDALCWAFQNYIVLTTLSGRGYLVKVIDQWGDYPGMIAYDLKLTSRNNLK